MNRRDLLKKLAIGAPALAALPLLGQATIYRDGTVADTILPPDEVDFTYKKWRVMWSGWDRMCNSDIFTGYWVAYGSKHDQWHLFSIWPGTTGSFVSGAVFDMSRQPGQELPTLRSTDQELARYAVNCLASLRTLIDKAGPPPLKYPVWL